MLWEERWHPLREEWVVVAAHRQHRPWGGEEVEREESPPPEHAGDCPLCPGNLRAGAHRNPDYTGTYVFDNDHPCVSAAAPEAGAPPDPLYRSRPARGVSRVVCYHPRHNATLAELDGAHVEELLGTWREQSAELAARPEVRHVLIFENKGAVVGVSNPHPHCQIYATNFVFKHVEQEVHACRRHHRETGRQLFGDILDAEERDGRRLLFANAGAVAFVPYFARYAYEVYVAPRARRARFHDLAEEELRDLAAALHRVLVQYDNLWQRSFPYVLAVHQAPVDGEEHGTYHTHVQIYPPLRQPHLRKHLAGPEIGGGNFLSDTSPEEKAAELRAQPAVHYRRRGASS